MRVAQNNWTFNLRNIMINVYHMLTSFVYLVVSEIHCSGVVFEAG